MRKVGKDDFIFIVFGTFFFGFLLGYAEKDFVLRSGAGWPLGGGAPPPRTKSFSACGTSCFHVWERMHTVLTHGAHGMTDVAGVRCTSSRVARIEEQAEGAARAALVERRRPIEAGGANVVEVRIPAAARSGKENSATITACELTTIHAVQRSPHRGGVVEKFVYLSQ